MAAFLRLLVAVGLIWVAVTYGWPRVKRFLDDPKVVTSVRGGGDGIGCVQAAQRAVGVFESGIGQFATPPLDESRWSDFRSRVQSRQDEAVAACGCGAEPCAIATGALSAFESLMRRFDTDLPQGQYPSSAAGDLSDIQDTLDRARDAVI